MSDERVELPADDQEFIKQKTIDGWTVEMIGHELRSNKSFIQDDTIEQYLAQEHVQEEIELEKQIMEKQQEVSRDDLIRELAEQKDYLVEKRRELEGENEEISSEQTKTLLKAIRQLAEMIDVLDAKDSGGADNVVNINKLEQNFDITESVQYLPAEDKRSVVKQLRDDDSIEDFMIVKKDDSEDLEKLRGISAE